MASNYGYTEGSGKIFSSLEVTGVQHPHSLMEFTDGAGTGAVKVSATNPLPVVRGTPSTAHLVTAASTNATVIKASAGTLRGISCFNNATYPIFIKFHNTASTPTAGAGVVFGVGIQAGTAGPPPIESRAFATGIAITVVKGIADANNDAVAASDALIEVWYE